MPSGRNIGVLALDDTVALGLGKHILARYLNAGLAAARPAKGRRAGEAYFAADTATVSIWDGTEWQTSAWSVAYFSFGDSLDGISFP